MRRKYTVLFALSLFLMLAGYCSLWLRAQQRQYMLDRQLIAALKRSDAKQSVILMEMGADPDTRYDLPSTPSLKLLTNQLLHHPLPSVTDNPTALMIACGGSWQDTDGSYHWPKSGSLHLVQVMLMRGADVNARDESGETALMAAIYGGQNDIIDCLLQHNAAINSQDKYGLTALHIAVARQQFEGKVLLNNEKLEVK